MKSRYIFALCLSLGVMMSGCGRSSSSNNTPTLKTDDMGGNFEQQQLEQRSSACLNNPALCEDSYTTASTWGLDAEPFMPSGNFGSQNGTTVNNFGGSGYNQFNTNGYSDNFGVQNQFGGGGVGVVGGGWVGPGVGGLGCDCGFGRQMMLIDGALLCVFTQSFSSSTRVATIGVSISHEDGETDTKFNASFNQINTNDVFTDAVPPMNPNACVVAAQVACNPGIPNPCAAVATPCGCQPVGGRPGFWCVPHAGGPTPTPFY